MWKSKKFILYHYTDHNRKLLSYLLSVSLSSQISQMCRIKLRKFKVNTDDPDYVHEAEVGEVGSIGVDPSLNTV